MTVSTASTSISSLFCQLQEPARSNADAWGRFVRLYTPLLYEWARRRGLRDDTAADLTQDVLVTLVRELPEYRRGPDQSFRGWLFTIARNRCTDLGRRSAAYRRALAGAPGHRSEGHSPFDEIEEEEHRRFVVHRALGLIRQEFSPDAFRAFEMVKVRGDSVAAAAKELGISKNAVYIHCSRVLARLRLEIEEFLE